MSSKKPIFSINTDFREFYHKTYTDSEENKKTSKDTIKRIKDYEIELITTFNDLQSVNIINDLIEHYKTYAANIVNFDDKMFSAYVIKYNLLNAIKKPTDVEKKEKDECNYIIVELLKVNIITAVSMESEEDLHKELKKLLEVPILRWIKEGIFPFRGPDKNLASCLAFLLYYHLIYVEQKPTQNKLLIQNLLSYMDINHTSMSHKKEHHYTRMYNSYITQIQKIKPIFDIDPEK